MPHRVLAQDLAQDLTVPPRCVSTQGSVYHESALSEGANLRVRSAQCHEPERALLQGM